MPFKILASSSDTIVEGTGPTMGDALLGVALGFSHVTTAGAKVKPEHERPIDVKTEGADAALLAVAFANELVYLFSVHGFLAADGRLEVARKGDGWRCSGVLRGEAFNPARHSFGTEVKAATMHEPVLQTKPEGAMARVLLDL